MRIGLVTAALVLVLTAPAWAGTYDVVTCDPSRAGGVNNAWSVGPVTTFGRPTTPDDAAGFSVTGSCASGGLTIRAGTGQSFAIWGNWQDFVFRAPEGAQIVKLALWRDGYGQGTASGGNWRMRAELGDGAPLGGPFGPDQCKTGEPYHPTVCRIGGTAYGEAAAARYDLATPSVRVGLECFAPEVRSCDTGAGGNPLGYYRLKAAVVTIRDDSAPALDAAGTLLEPGWRRGDSVASWSASDNTGIRTVRLLVDGQERSRADLPCDFTSARPCADAANRTLGLGDAPIADGARQLQLVATDAAGNETTVTRTVSLDAHAPEAVLARASGRTISVRVADGASGVAAGAIEVRNRRSEPFRALPATLANGRLTARLDRGSAARAGIRVSVTDAAGNATAGQLSELALRVGGRSLRGGAASVGYGRAARFSGALRTRDGVALAGQPVSVEQTLRGATPAVVATVTTDARGRFSYRAPAGVSRTLRFIYGGGADLAPLTRRAQLRVRASSTISASPRVLRGGGRVRFTGRLGLRGTTAPRSGKLVELQAYDGGRWRTFATARARGAQGRWSSSYRFGGTPGRYPVRVRIRREAVFPYDLGYSRSIVVRVR